MVVVFGKVSLKIVKVGDDTWCGVAFVIHKVWQVHCKHGQFGRHKSQLLPPSPQIRHHGKHLHMCTLFDYRSFATMTSSQRS